MNRLQDLLVKNIKRYQKQAKRDGSSKGEDLDIIPVTFVLPQDYALFAEVRGALRICTIAFPCLLHTASGLM